MWRPFNSLSGGQQALACLALSFAMQAAFPAPFFFYDEIDSALDVATAERVGAYLRNEASGSAQYLVSGLRSSAKAYKVLCTCMLVPECMWRRRPVWSAYSSIMLLALCSVHRRFV